MPRLISGSDALFVNLLCVVEAVMQCGAEAWCAVVTEGQAAAFGLTRVVLLVLGPAGQYVMAAVTDLGLSVSGMVDVCGMVDVSAVSGLSGMADLSRMLDGCAVGGFGLVLFLGGLAVGLLV
jgi:hypothetical protein